MRMDEDSGPLDDWIPVSDWQASNSDPIGSGNLAMAPSRPVWRRRSLVAAAVVLVVAGCVGARAWLAGGHGRVLRFSATIDSASAHPPSRSAGLTTTAPGSSAASSTANALHTAPTSAAHRVEASNSADSTPNNVVDSTAGIGQTSPTHTTTTTRIATTSDPGAEDLTFGTKVPSSTPVTLAVSYQGLQSDGSEQIELYIQHLSLGGNNLYINDPGGGTMLGTSLINGTSSLTVTYRIYPPMSGDYSISLSDEVTHAHAEASVGLTERAAPSGQTLVEFPTVYDAPTISVQYSGRACDSGGAIVIFTYTGMGSGAGLKFTSTQFGYGESGLGTDSLGDGQDYMDVSSQHCTGTTLPAFSAWAENGSGAAVTSRLSVRVPN